MNIPFLTNRWLQICISFLFAAILVWIIHPDPDPYIADIHYTERFKDAESSFFFQDLDHDGLDERVRYFYNQSFGMVSCLIETHDNRVSKQINFPCDGYAGSQVFATDVDGDQQSELYFLTIYEDCVVAYEGMLGETTGNDLSPPIFLDSVKLLRGDPGLMISNIVELDINNDGVKEIIFGLAGIYKTYYPRKVYAIDPVSQSKLKESAPLGIAVEGIWPVDLDQDGVLELAATAGASANIEDSSLYAIDDHSTWFLSFDQELCVLPDLVSFSGDHKMLRYTSKVPLGADTLTGVFFNRGPEEQDPFLFQTSRYDSLERIVTLNPQKYGYEIQVHPISYGDKALYAVVANTGTIGFFDSALNQIKEHRFSQSIRGYVKPVPSTRMMPELVPVRSEIKNTILFYTGEGRKLAEEDFSETIEIVRKVGYTTFFNQGSYYVTDMDFISYFSFRKNPWYMGWWILGPLFFFLFYLIIEFILWNQRNQQKREESLVRKMRKLELASIKAQIDPHFSFNALNVLNFLAGEGDSKGIHQFTHHYAGLLRTQVSNSAKPYAKLFDELQFVEHYIELQKLRFDVPIQYDVDVDPDVNMNLHIPKMMIHTHVENAIKHGLIPAGGGNIWVRVSKPNGQTVIEIGNDGVPRSESKGKMDASTGKGLAILDQLYELFYQLYKVRIRQEMVDLTQKDFGRKGLLVRIWIR